MSDEEFHEAIQGAVRKAAERKQEAAAAAVKKLADEMELLRLHADAVHQCLTGIVEPVLQDAIAQMAGTFHATLMKGRTDDPRLGSEQTIMELRIEALGATSALKYTGDVDRGTINKVPVMDVTTASVRVDTCQFITRVVRRPTIP